VFTYSVIVAEKPAHGHDTVGGSGPVAAFARPHGAGAGAG
jgi:hypothetical protein